MRRRMTIEIDDLLARAKHALGCARHVRQSRRLCGRLFAGGMTWRGSSLLNPHIWNGCSLADLDVLRGWDVAVRSA